MWVNIRSEQIGDWEIKSEDIEDGGISMADLSPEVIAAITSSHEPWWNDYVIPWLSIMWTWKKLT